MKPLRHARHSASFAYGLLGIRAPERVFCLHMHSMSVDNEHVCVVCVWVLRGCAKRVRAGRGRDRTAHALRSRWHLLNPRSAAPPAGACRRVSPRRIPAVPAGTRGVCRWYGHMQQHASGRSALARGNRYTGANSVLNDRVSSQCSALRWCSLVLRVRFSLDAGPCAGRGVAQNISATRPLPGPSRSGRRGAADAHRHHPGEASPLHSCLERLRSVPASCHNLRSHFLQTREASGSTRLPTLALLTLLALLLDA